MCKNSIKATEKVSALYCDADDNRHIQSITAVFSTQNNIIIIIIIRRMDCRLRLRAHSRSVRNRRCGAWRMPITAALMEHPSSWQLCAGVTTDPLRYTHNTNTDISLHPPADTHLQTRRPCPSHASHSLSVLNEPCSDPLRYTHNTNTNISLHPPTDTRFTADTHLQSRRSCPSHASHSLSVLNEPCSDPLRYTHNTNTNISLHPPTDTHLQTRRSCPSHASHSLSVLNQPCSDPLRYTHNTNTNISLHPPTDTRFTADTHLQTRRSCPSHASHSLSVLNEPCSDPLLYTHNTNTNISLHPPTDTHLQTRRSCPSHASHSLSVLNEPCSDPLRYTHNTNTNISLHPPTDTHLQTRRSCPSHASHSLSVLNQPCSDPLRYTHNTNTDISLHPPADTRFTADTHLQSRRPCPSHASHSLSVLNEPCSDPLRYTHNTNTTSLSILPLTHIYRAEDHVLHMHRTLYQSSTSHAQTRSATPTTPTPTSLSILPLTHASPLTHIYRAEDHVLHMHRTLYQSSTSHAQTRSATPTTPTPTSLSILPLTHASPLTHIYRAEDHVLHMHRTLYQSSTSHAQTRSATPTTPTPTSLSILPLTHASPLTHIYRPEDHVLHMHRTLYQSSTSHAQTRSATPTTPTPTSLSILPLTHASPLTHIYRPEDHVLHMHRTLYQSSTSHAQTRSSTPTTPTPTSLSILPLTHIYRAEDHVLHMHRIKSGLNEPCSDPFTCNFILSLKRRGTFLTSAAERMNAAKHKKTNYKVNYWFWHHFDLDNCY